MALMAQITLIGSACREVVVPQKSFLLCFILSTAVVAELDPASESISAISAISAISVISAIGVRFWTTR